MRAKGQYIHFLPDVLRLLGAGRTFGLGQCDAGRGIIESRFCVERPGSYDPCKDARNIYTN